MNVLAVMVESDAPGRVQAIAATFGVDWPHLIAQVISFAIVCALLYAFAYRPVLRMLAARRQQIAQGLADTEKINAQLAAIETQRQEVLGAARGEAGRLIDEARDVAQRVREQERQRAVAAAEQIVAKARDEAAREHTRMLGDLRREVGRLVVQTTAAVAGKVLSADDQRRLSEEATRRLA